MMRLVRWVLVRARPFVGAAYQRLSAQPVPNLEGDRDIEHSWAAAKLPKGPGRLMDFGCGTSWLGLLAARMGYETVAIDLTDVHWAYAHEGLRFSRTDLFGLPDADASYDVIVNVSAIEHVGLGGRYGVTTDSPDGDLEAMQRFSRLLRPGGCMLLTLPAGRDEVVGSRHRVYGAERLPRLLEGWTVSEEEFWGKDADNRWRREDRQAVLAMPASDHYYGLGLFVLKKDEA